MTLLAYGCPTMAIVRAFGVDERTVRHWHQQAGIHCQQVQQSLVETLREQGQGQVDELHIKTHGGVVWVPEPSPSPVAYGWERWCNRSGRSVSPCVCWRWCNTVCSQRPSDSVSPYVSAARQVFRHPQPRHGVLGRRRLQRWPGLVLVQVVKHSVQWRLVGIVRQVALGTWPQAFTAFRQSHGYGVFGTAWIERLNATFRAWVRRGRALAFP